MIFSLHAFFTPFFLCSWFFHRVLFDGQWTLIILFFRPTSFLTHGSSSSYEWMRSLKYWIYTSNWIPFYVGIATLGFKSLNDEFEIDEWFVGLDNRCRIWLVRVSVLQLRMLIGESSSPFLIPLLFYIGVFFLYFFFSYLISSFYWHFLLPFPLHLCNWYCSPFLLAIFPAAQCIYKYNIWEPFSRKSCHLAVSNEFSLYPIFKKY